ncbi:hypothetical protein VP424E501_P0110 [Vibrio phage 424E50-1]|nr:hypothetical protein VP424E501_P0110 [Vibrio phage 424E50-1]
MSKVFKMYKTETVRGDRKDTHLYTRSSIKSIESLFRLELAMMVQKTHTKSLTEDKAIETILKSQNKGIVSINLNNNVLMLDGKAGEDTYFWIWETEL